MSKIYVLELPNGFAKVHYFDERGNALCGCGAKAPIGKLERECNLQISCQGCMDKKKTLKKPRNLFSNIKKVNKVEILISTKEYPFELPNDVQWIARDSDGDWVGFLNKPILVCMDGQKFWMDQEIGTKFYIFGKYPEYERYSKVEETLKEI